MGKNEGNIDRVLRVIVGLALLVFAVFGTTSPYHAWGWVGVVPLLTGLVGTCPLYSVLGINTCGIKKA